MSGPTGHSPIPIAKPRLPQWLAFSLLTIVFWGSWGAISKVLSEDVDAFANQILFTIGLIPLIMLMLPSMRPVDGDHRKRGILYALVTGILGGTGNIAFFASLTSGGQASIVVPMAAMSPLVTVVIAVVVLRESMGRSQKLGVGLALAAIYILSR